MSKRGYTTTWFRDIKKNKQTHHPLWITSVWRINGTNSGCSSIFIPLVSQTQASASRYLPTKPQAWDATINEKCEYGNVHGKMIEHGDEKGSKVER
jgi:hypothetical protein